MSEWFGTSFQILQDRTGDFGDLMTERAVVAFRWDRRSCVPGIANQAGAAAHAGAAASTRGFAIGEPKHMTSGIAVMYPTQSSTPCQDPRIRSGAQTWGRKCFLGRRWTTSIEKRGEVRLHYGALFNLADGKLWNGVHRRLSDLAIPSCRIVPV
jgi:hypothetical protein